MKFTLNIDCNNAAFEGDTDAEVARILKEVAEKIEGGASSGTISDINGNRVGYFSY